MMPPVGMEQFHEEDCTPIPTEGTEQVIVQLDEDQKLYEVQQGYMKTLADQLNIRPAKRQINLDTILHKPKKSLQTRLAGLIEHHERKISDKIKELFTKNQTHRNMEDMDKYVDIKQVNKFYNEIKNQFPNEFSEQSIKEIIKIQQAFKKDANEHGCVINLKNGKIFNPRDGKNSTVTISYSGIKNMENLASTHNHPIHGFNAPSDVDIDNMLHNPNEKYCIVVSENKIWIVKNKYYKIDLHEKNNAYLCVDGLDIVKGVRDILEKNRVNELHERGSIENINSIVDKEILEVFKEFNVYSKVLMIGD